MALINPWQNILAQKVATKIVPQTGGGGSWGGTTSTPVQSVVRQPVVATKPVVTKAGPVLSTAQTTTTPTRSLAGTLSTSAPSVQSTTTTSIKTPERTINTTGQGQDTSFANLRALLAQTARFTAAAGPSPEDYLNMYAKAGIPLSSPGAIQSALNRGTISRAGMIQDTYKSALDLINEQEQRQADYVSQVMSGLPKSFLSQMSGAEFDEIKSGNISPELKQKLAQATAMEGTTVGEKPITEKIGDTLYQYNPQTGGWDVAIGAAGTTPISQGEMYAGEKANRTISTVDELLTQAKASPQIFGRTAAMPIPEWLRSDEYRNYQALLSKLESNIGFAELTEMREASKTGGALGQVSERELALLTSTLGALKMTQDPKQIMEQLQTVKESTMRWQVAKMGFTAQEIEEASDQYGGIENVYKGLFTKPVSSGLNSSKITTAYNDGQKGGQCGTFAHNLVEFPPVGDSKAEKIAAVDKYGIPYYQWQQNPQVGDVLITDESRKYGHVAVVNAILPDGTVQLTESNMVPPNAESVSNTRRIAIDSPRIYGAIRGNLKV